MQSKRQQIDRIDRPNGVKIHEELIIRVVCKSEQSWPGATLVNDITLSKKVVVFQKSTQDSRSPPPPKSYSDHKKSGLTVEITEETTDLDFDLSWEIDEDHSKPWVEKF